MVSIRRYCTTRKRLSSPLGIDDEPVTIDAKSRDTGRHVNFDLAWVSESEWGPKRGEKRMSQSGERPPLPPFDLEAAVKKVRMAEDGWNSRDPAKVSLAYTVDSVWRNRSEFLQGRDAIVNFLTRKWAKELDYRLIKELWVHGDRRIAVRFAYEWHDDGGNWYRSYGNENWEFADNGLMRRRIASINDLPITLADRKYHWPLGRRPDEHPSLSDLDL
jgi:nuclear transport factor 2 (NTF2) superfamily protein